MVFMVLDLGVGALLVFRRDIRVVEEENVVEMT